MELIRLLWIIFFSICAVILTLGIFCSFRVGQECFSFRVVLIWVVFFIFLAFGAVCMFFDFNRTYLPGILDFLVEVKVFESEEKSE